MEKVIEYPQIVAIGCSLGVHKDIIVGTISRENQIKKHFARHLPAVRR